MSDQATKASIPKLTYLGRSINISEEQVMFNELQKTMWDFAFEAQDEFQEFYKSCRSITNVINKSESKVSELIVPSVEFCIKRLVDNGIYSVDYQKFIDEYVSKSDFWGKAFSKVNDEYEEIVLTEEQQKEYRRMRRENRGRWQGGGFGVGGAISGAAKAGAMNMVSGMGHSIVNGFANMATSISTDRKLRKLYEDEETVNSLSLGVANTIYNLSYQLSKCFNDKASISSYLNGYKESYRTSEANSIITNCNYISDDEQCLDALIKAFILNPCNKEWYRYALQRFGDKNGEIDEINKFFGIVNTEILKKGEIEKVFDSAKIESYIDAINVKKAVEEKIEDLHFSGKCDILEKLDKLIVELKEKELIKFVKSSDISNKEAAIETRQKLLIKMQDMEIASNNTVLKELDDIIEKYTIKELTVNIKVNNRDVSFVCQSTEEKPKIIYYNDELNRLINELHIEDAPYSKTINYLDNVRSCMEELGLIENNTKFSELHIKWLENIKEELVNKYNQAKTNFIKQYDLIPQKTKCRIYINEENKCKPHFVNEAINSYMNALGYMEDEIVQFAFDNSEQQNGSTGFVFTNRGFYACNGNRESERFFTDDFWLFSTSYLNSIEIRGKNIIVNDFPVSINKVQFGYKSNVYYMLCYAKKILPIYKKCEVSIVPFESANKDK